MSGNKWNVRPDAEQIGVTSGAFSLGKRLLLSWLNELVRPAAAAAGAPR